MPETYAQFIHQSQASRRAAAYYIHNTHTHTREGGFELKWGHASGETLLFLPALRVRDQSRILVYERADLHELSHHVLICSWWRIRIRT